MLNPVTDKVQIPPCHKKAPTTTEDQSVQGWKGAFLSKTIAALFSKLQAIRFILQTSAMLPSKSNQSGPAIPPVRIRDPGDEAEARQAKKGSMPSPCHHGLSCFLPMCVSHF